MIEKVWIEVWATAIGYTEHTQYTDSLSMDEEFHSFSSDEERDEAISQLVQDAEKYPFLLEIG